MNANAQIVSRNLATAIATWYNEDEVTPSEDADKNACILENEGSIFVSFPIHNSVYLNNPAFNQLMKNIVLYLAPGAAK